MSYFVTFLPLLESLACYCLLGEYLQHQLLMKQPRNKVVVLTNFYLGPKCKFLIKFIFPNPSCTLIPNTKFVQEVTFSFLNIFYRQISKSNDVMLHVTICHNMMGCKHCALLWPSDWNLLMILNTDIYIYRYNRDYGPQAELTHLFHHLSLYDKGVVG